ncbi:MAG TPA: class I SAM-dependent methyltransferase [Candidatus Paceibacterota bacterium]
MRLIYSILQWLSNKDLINIRRLITEILASKLPHHEQSKLFWDNNGYIRNLRISPANPSEDDLRLYKKYLTDEKNNKKVLLLGSTPLLRHLLSEAGFKNYVVADFSFTAIENSLQALNKLGIDLEPENETWLKSEWLEMPLEPESFDCIMGDMVFTQIEPSKQPLFVKKISSLLKPRGNFIGRMYICNTNFDYKDPKKIIEEILFSEDFENTTEQRFKLLYRLRDRLRDKKTQTTSPHIIINEILQYKTQDEKELDFLRWAAKMVSGRAEIGLPFITQTKDEITDVISKEFLLEASTTASDYSSEYFPIYVLHKKT